MTRREAVVAEAMTWLRTPYRHQGRVKGAGVDCAMLLADVYFRVGMIPWIDPRPYPPDWHLHRGEERYLAWVKQHAREISGPPSAGDIVLWRFGRCFSHGAIVTEWPAIIHAHRPERSCCLGDAEADLSLTDGGARPRLLFTPFKEGE